MKDTVYESLFERKLVTMFEQGIVSDESIKREWYRNYQIAFPYKLDSSGNIKNCIMNQLVADDEADKMILGQANKVRNERIRVMENNRVYE